MKILARLILLLGWLWAAGTPLQAAGLERGREWRGPAEPEVQLPDAPLEPGSVVVAQDLRRLREGVDFRLDAARGRLVILQPSLLGRDLRVQYRVLWLELPASLSLRPRASLPWVDKSAVDPRPDSLGGARLERREQEAGARLRTSGSFLRGVRVGSDGSVGMESGLRLQVDGMIGPDVEVEAFLSDRNTPLQPEGRSQNLEEVDRIHVQVRSPRWRAQLGDIDLDLRGGRYLELKRTVDGVQAGYDDGRTRVAAHLAGSRGRFRRQEWTAQEGVQGPWQLRSEQGGADVVVLAGSERVWLDGLELTRGEDRDYVMDYGLAQLTFTARRPLTQASRVAVEFQYAERVYARSLYGVQAAAPLPAGMSLELGVAGERDDADRPLDAFLDAADRQVLALAGDGEDGAVAAWGSGVRETDPGEGSYRLVDSLAGQWGEYAWVEDPDGDPDVRWDLRFSELGRASDGAYLGDYSRQISSSGRIWYRFEGRAAGPYAPLIPLSAPTAHEVADGRLSWRRGRLQLEGEAALSRLDKNLFSGRDDGDNAGSALRAGARYATADWPAAKPVGRWELDGLLVGEQADFQPLQQVDEVEFERLYGLARAGGLRRRDAALALRGGDSLLVRGKGAWLSREDEDSRMLEGAWRWRPRLGAYLDGSLRDRRRAGATIGRLQGARSEQGWLEAGRTWTTAWEGERQTSGARDASGSLWREGLARVEQRWGSGEASVEHSRRTTHGASAGDWWLASQASQWRSRVRRTGSWQGELDWTHRALDYARPDSADQVRDVALLEWRRQSEGMDAALRYQAENSLAAERITRYLQVDSLQGDYSRDPFNPDLFVPDPDGDYVAVPYETGRQRKAALLKVEGDLRWEKGPWSGDHHLQADEQSTLADPARLYLLAPSAFLSDSTISARVQGRHDLEFSEDRLGQGGQRRWRLRLQDERGLERPSAGSARRSWLRSAGLRLQDRRGPWRGAVEAGRRWQESRMPGQPQDERLVRAWWVEGELARELFPGWLGRLASQGEWAEEARADIRGARLKLEPTLDARLGGKGSLSARVSWQRAWSASPVVPYELLGGARVGRTWRAGLEGRWQAGRQTRLSLAWQVDALPARQAQHTGRLQVQSFF